MNFGRFQQSLSHTAENLSPILLAEEWHAPPLSARLFRIVRNHRHWIKPFCQRLLRRFPEKPDAQAVAAFIATDKGFERAYERNPFRIFSCEPDASVMRPKPGPPADWRVPALCSEADVCAWLSLPSEKLLWLADVHGRERERTREPLRNYSYLWIPKRRSGARLIESPKACLKAIQRRILGEILARIPVHSASYGFARGGSILKHAALHCGKDTVVHLDLKDFFLSVPASRVHAIFRTAGYPTPVARILAGFCLNSVPLDVLAKYPEERMPPLLAKKFRAPHLPQGAPTSPMLANLCAYRMDIRLAALARRFDWTYSRYADDLLFSGSKQSRAFTRRLEIWAGAVAVEESLPLNTRKTRVMPRGQMQRACGLVLNEKPNLPREDYEALKALLFNCARFGPESQNRESRDNFRAHLLGKIGFVEQVNHGRGAKLRALFGKIDWR